MLMSQTSPQNPYKCKIHNHSNVYNGFLGFFFNVYFRKDHLENTCLLVFPLLKWRGIRSVELTFTQEMWSWICEAYTIIWLAYRLLTEVRDTWFRLFLKWITSTRLLPKGYWFTKTAKSVFLLLSSRQTGLRSKHTNSHLKAVGFTPMVRCVFLSSPKFSNWTREKKKPHWKLPVWFAGCQPEYLAAAGGPVGLRAAADVVLVGAGLVSAFSWQVGMLLTEAAVKAMGWAASRESLFRNEGGKNKIYFLLGQYRCGVTTMHLGAAGHQSLLCHHQCWGDHSRTMLWKLYF